MNDEIPSIPRLRKTRGVGQICLLLILLQTFCVAVQAQDSENDNPTGPAGDYNGEVTTGGGYDAFTQNEKRSITDLTVPGSNGQYPLAFTRTYNSQMSPVGGDLSYFGDGGNWRHSYQWTISPAPSDSHGTVWTVAYPDGAVVTFRHSRSTAPAGENPNYLRGPTGTADRLELGGSLFYLHRSDGGLVTFGENNSGFHASSITDPYGAATRLSYNVITTHVQGATYNYLYLSQVVEPGGRWLKFLYTTTYYSGPGANNDPTGYSSWVTLNQVQAGRGQTVNQTATYNYATFGTEEHNAGSEAPNQWSSSYYVLSNVSYDAEPSVSGSGNVHAYYTYAQVGDAIPLLSSAQDPHYAGAMANIRYATIGTEEQNFETSPPQMVSHLDRSTTSNSNPGPNSSTETRGDKDANGAAITRTFTFNQNVTQVAGGSYDPVAKRYVPTDASEATNAKNAQLTSCSDWQSNTAYMTYYAAGNANGQGNLSSVTDAAGNVTTYGHEPITGKVSAVVLPDGRLRQWTYLSKDLSETSLPSTKPYYLYSTTDERGHSTIYHRYANTGLVCQVDYPDGSHEYYQYQEFVVNNAAYYKVSLYQNRLGAQITYTYGANSASGSADMLLQTTRAYQEANNGPSHTETTTFQYDALDRLSQSKDPRGVTTQFSYDACHRLKQTLHVADGTHADRVYDDYGNCTSVSDELGHAITTAYDSYRRPIKVTVPVNDGTTVNLFTKFAYDPRGPSSNSIASATSHTRPQWSVSWTKSGKGVERIYTPNGWQLYDVRGLTVTDPGNGSPVGVAQGLGFACSYISSFSAIGQVLASVDAENQTTTYTYDNCGRKKTVTDPLGGPSHTTTSTYYAAGESASSGSGNNCSGLLKSVQGPGPDAGYPATVTTTYADYDANSHPILTTKPAIDWSNGGVTLQSAFDALGNLTSQSDGAQASGQHTTPYLYDQLGRKDTCSYPDGTSEKWTYDASGNLVTYTNRARAVCTYQYDGRNRCGRYDWNDGYTAAVAYGYDAANHVIEVLNGYSNIQYTYDDSGAVRTEQAQLYGQSGPLTTTYSHDADGRLGSILYPSGDEPVYAYDNQDRCVNVSFGGTPYARYSYDPARLMLRCIYSGVDTGYAYQNNGRLMSHWHYHGDMVGNHVNDASINYQFYGYAPDGRVSWSSRVADGGQSGSSLEDGRGDAYLYYGDGSLYLAFQNYGYSGGWPNQQSTTADSQPDGGHLVSAGGSTSSYGAEFDYDLAGNPTRFAVQGSPEAFSFNGENLLDDPQYNANGDTADALRGWQFGYDAEHRLLSAAGPSGQTASFGYDGLGRMVYQSLNGVLTCYYYAGSQRIAEYNASTQPVNRYFFDGPGSDQIMFRYDQTRGFFWYLHDGLGNTTHLVDGAGNVLERYLYDAWGTPSVYDAAGNPRSTGSLYDNRYLFKSGGGYEWFPAMGMYYCRARWYLPAFGRWLQPDPIGQAGGLNL